MKAKLFFASLAATALLSGCSSDDPAITPDGGENVGEPSFLAVNIVTTGESAAKSRAQVPGDPTNDDDESAIYEEGLQEENAVSSVRFYFFDESGAAAAVKMNSVTNTKLNYLDWTPSADETPDPDKDMPNVEKILGTVLILQTPAGDEMPSTMVAIVNPTNDLPTTTATLDDLKKKYGNYAKDNVSFGSFVMSNSTYAKDNAAVMEVDVADHIMTSDDAATKIPVDIYVERTVAKIRLKSGLNAVKTLTNGTKLYDPSPRDEEGNIEEANEQKYGDKKIYVKFLGWNATAVADKSRLMKKINPTWSGTLLGSTFGPWNWVDYSRSFWALNVNNTDNDATLDYQYGAFQPSDESSPNTANLFQAQAKDKFDGTQWVYVNENASDDFDNGSEATTPTKVIIAAQLVDENGDGISFAQYGAERMTVDGLKTKFAEIVPLYKKTVDGSTTKYTKITPDDLDIKTATDVNGGTSTPSDRYKVYVQLTAAAENADWYPSSKSTQSESDKLTKEKVNQTLKELGSAKIWNGGYTYYYFDIKHGEKKGVVRNHIYEATLTSLVGLGTPVYDPDEIIYPEKPTPDNDTYLAARINILSWRVVKQDVTLQW